MNETVLYSGPSTANAATLYVFDKTEEIKKYVVNDSVTTIGRKYDGSNAIIGLDSSIASRRHGEIQKMDNYFIYRDLGSLNGTYINGELYGKNDEAKGSVYKLNHGDVLRIDQRNLRFTHQDACLMIFALGESNQTWNSISLKNLGNIEIGRAASEEKKKRGKIVQLNDENISRKHATFKRGVKGWSVVDHNSTNGVFVNNNRIEQATPLYRFDVIRIADSNFIFLEDKILYNSVETDTNQLSIHIVERTVKEAAKKKVLLQNIDMTINHGEMVLVLGGSGAGKTTFFNAVMGSEKADGKIIHGDVDIYKDFDKVKSEIGFVPQQDLLRDNDTVYDTLKDAASMKMPRSTKKNEREERIDYCLELLGLQRERNSLVRKLSGGQRKRLSIAVEFIANPSLFFLDEPDSGLDGIMATSLMENLRVIADEGKIVMVITHAPDRVARLFDKIVVLAKSAETNSGCLAFFGTVAEGFEFFETDSLEGIVRRINRPDEGGDGLSDHYIKKYAEKMGR